MKSCSSMNYYIGEEKINVLNYLHNILSIRCSTNIRCYLYYFFILILEHLLLNIFGGQIIIHKSIIIHKIISIAKTIIQNSIKISIIRTIKAISFGFNGSFLSRANLVSLIYPARRSADSITFLTTSLLIMP